MTRDGELDQGLPAMNRRIEEGIQRCMSRQHAVVMLMPAPGQRSVLDDGQQ